MSSKHSSPTHPRRDKGRQVSACAPYNFVPLPEAVVTAQPPFTHDVYHSDALTGWIECELETCSPTYVRGLMTEEQFRTMGQKKPDQLTVEEKVARAPFYATSEEQVEGYFAPVIPGSTLRGMIRTLVEIAGVGRMRWVADEPTFTFRAVAAARDDPLRVPYEEILGRYGAEVKAGYLACRGDDWYIMPARTPRSIGLGAEKSSYLKVKEHLIPADAIPGFVRLTSPHYRPGFFPVTFEAQERRGKRGMYVAITRIGSPQAGYRYQHEGILVCSGNMLETSQQGPSPRKSHALILLPDPKVRPIKLDKQTVRDYLAGLTTFQKELWAGNDGCLKDGGPVFYIEREGVVLAFGHSPHFRVPAKLLGTNRAVTPRDFIPAELTRATAPDLADAIFGWVEDDSSPEGQMAGRVFFGDAQFVGAGGQVWYKPEPIVPHVLSGPKPTTFQHYLTQDREHGHDPDEKVSLAHYGTSPGETQIRGHKLYWHKGPSPGIEASPSELNHESQLTRMVPLAPGVKFKATVHFENLRTEELGALLWALTLPGPKSGMYRHRLGMGKPLGMGSISIQARLCLTDRKKRYEQLFAGYRWWQAEAEDSMARHVQAFEQYVLRALGSSVPSMSDLERIQMLLAMLEWHDEDDVWLETTRYMEIERGPDKINEYKERPVLPDPLAVLAGQPVRSTAPRPAPRVETQPVRSIEIGTVRWYNQQKGYGVILRDGGDEIFVHKSGIQGGGTLRKNQRVRFVAGKGLKGPTALDVEVL